jgi:hypothetical protein
MPFFFALAVVAVREKLGTHSRNNVCTALSGQRLQRYALTTTIRPSEEDMLWKTLLCMPRMFQKLPKRTFHQQVAPDLGSPSHDTISQTGRL